MTASSFRQRQRHRQAVVGGLARLLDLRTGERTALATGEARPALASSGWLFVEQHGTSSGVCAGTKREPRLEVRLLKARHVRRVRTGVAIRDGDPLPDIATPDALRTSLLAAPAIYFPDAQRSTAGIHFASVLARLGIADVIAARLRAFANGATAMRELASDPQRGAIGCTQVTEINCTPGIRLVGALPEAFELATIYTAAVSAVASQPQLAKRFVELIAGPQTRALRQQGGFEFTMETTR